MDRMRQFQSVRNISMRAVLTLFLEWYAQDRPDQSKGSYIGWNARRLLSHAEANEVISLYWSNQE